MLKVYANVIHPGKGLADALRPLCHEAVSTDGGDNSVTEKDDMVLLSFEGIYFPCEEAAGAIPVSYTHLFPSEQRVPGDRSHRPREGYLR